MTDENKPLNPQQVEVKVHYRVPSKTPSLYAHHMFVQPGEHEVLLSFFEIIPPPLTANPSETELNVVKDAGIVAECIARISIAKARFPGFARAMQEIVDFLAKEDQIAEEKAKANADN